MIYSKLQEEDSMKSVFTCKNCNCMMFSCPTKDYGRCPQCGHKLYPNGYNREAVSDAFYDGFQGKIYPAPSWPEDK